MTSLRVKGSRPRAKGELLLKSFLYSRGMAWHGMHGLAATALLGAGGCSQHASTAHGACGTLFAIHTYVFGGAVVARNRRCLEYRQTAWTYRKLRVICMVSCLSGQLDSCLCVPPCRSATARRPCPRSQHAPLCPPPAFFMFRDRWQGDRSDGGSDQRGRRRSRLSPGPAEARRGRQRGHPQEAHAGMLVCWRARCPMRAGSSFRVDEGAERRGLSLQ